MFNGLRSGTLAGRLKQAGANAKRGVTNLPDRATKPPFPDDLAAGIV